MTSESVVSEVVVSGGILVGDDGSEGAAAAIRAAAEEARLRGCTLHVLRAWSIVTAVRPADVPDGFVPSLVEFQAATLAAEEQRVATLLGETDLSVEVHVVHAPAVKALINAAGGAALLVLGARGRGGFSRLMLGSTADQCLRYSPCSVLIVRKG